MVMALYFVMNVSKKQALHDRICSTYVVGSHHTGPIITASGSRFCIKKAAFAACFILLGMSLVFYQFRGTESETKFKHSLGEIKQGDLIQIKQGIAETPMGRFHYLRLVAVPNAKVKPQALADEVGKAALKHYRGIERFDLVVVDIRTGYNLGIHRSYLDTSWCLSPVQWSKEIGKPVHHKRVVPLL
jgi:hypothetical protein